MLRLADLDLPGLRSLLDSWECKPSHAQTLLRAFYAQSGVVDLDPLSIGKELKRRLAEAIGDRPLGSRVVGRHVSADGTTKLLIGFDGPGLPLVGGAPAGGAVEAVLMPGFREGMAAGCVSSQIGCAMGCDFCASTKNGLERHLTAGEITEQFLHLKQAADALGRRLKTIVFMGMGEPMHNLDAVLGAIRRIADPDLGGLGWRQVTVSTVGVVPGIDRLADADLNVHLALSLHAPDDATRSRLIPANRRYPVAEVMAATRRFADRTGRVPTIEYTMLAGVNDTDDQAEQLADLMAGFRAHVNLIPYNPIGPGVSGRVYERPTRDRMIRFLTILRDRNVVSHFRDTRGDDVGAACGQLKLSSR